MIAEHTQGEAVVSRLETMVEDPIGTMYIGVSVGERGLCRVSRLSTLDEEDEPNADRIRAAWNACNGISTEALENAVIENMIALLRRVDEVFTIWDAEGTLGDACLLAGQVACELKQLEGK